MTLVIGLAIGLALGLCAAGVVVVIQQHMVDALLAQQQSLLDRVQAGPNYTLGEVPMPAVGEPLGGPAYRTVYDETGLIKMREPVEAP